VRTQTLPNNKTITFDYDANGNMTVLQPPGRPSHGFGFTPINLPSRYTPPVVPGTGQTIYRYNGDKQLIGVDRPDGQTTTFNYGIASGRLDSIDFSRGALAFGYDSAGRLSSIADPGGVSLSYTYDGFLPLTETWTGGVAGTVTRTFNSDFLVATEQVAGTPAVSFVYGGDLQLFMAGDLTIHRDENSQAELLDLDFVSETFDYNTFGEEISQNAEAYSGTWSSVFSVTTSRDDLGRIAQRIETVDGLTRVFGYGYDAAGRLEAVTRNGTLVVLYRYDDNGNRLSAEGGARALRRHVR
jgi:YD repeat-containing protein